MIESKQLFFDKQQAGLCDFRINDAFVLRVEATFLGVFRIRVVPISKQARLDNSKLNSRAKARQSLLLADRDISSDFEVQTQQASWRLSHGNAVLELCTNPFEVRFYLDDCLVLRGTQLSFHEDDSYWKLAFSLEKGEPVYGLGRSDSGLNRRGQTIISDENTTHYMPLAWSPKGWGIFPASLQRVEHQLTSQDYCLQVHEDCLDIFFYIAPVAEVFNQFSATVGRPGQPPLRALGIWFDQAEQQSLEDCIEQAHQLEEAGFAVDTLNLATPSWFTFSTDKLNLDWDESRTGEIRQFVNDYLKGNKQLCLPTFPGIPVGTLLFRDLEDRAWLLLDNDNKAYTIETPAGKMGLLDLSHKDAFQFWESRHQQLLDNTDTALRLAYPYQIQEDINARHGETGALLKQLYPLWLEQSLFEAQAFYKTPSEAFVYRDSLSLNSPRSIGVTINHPIRSFDDLKGLLQQHLSAQASGVIAQWHRFSLQEKSSKLFLRLLALSVFSTGFSIAADSQCLPTDFDAKTQSKAKVLWDLRYRLMPYILGIIEDATRTGLPVQRAMALAFPEDKQSHLYEQQYLFGPALLVAPILDDSQHKMIYLPQGEAWWDLNTGVRYEGGQILDYTCDEASIPVFGREGHMLCMGPVLRSLEDFNSARILDEVWLFGMPLHNPVVMRNKIRVMQMQGSSYIKGFEGLRILQPEGLEVKRRGAEVRISRER